MASGSMATLPPGWKRHINNRGRVVYFSPPPVTQIRTKSELLRYQNKGRYKELDAHTVNFMVKIKKYEKTHEILLPGTGSIPHAQAIPDNSEDILSVDYFAYVDEPSSQSSQASSFFSSEAATSSSLSEAPTSAVVEKTSS